MKVLVLSRSVMELVLSSWTPLAPWNHCNTPYWTSLTSQTLSKSLSATDIVSLALELGVNQCPHSDLTWTYLLILHFHLLSKTMASRPTLVSHTMSGAASSVEVPKGHRLLCACKIPSSPLRREAWLIYSQYWHCLGADGSITIRFPCVNQRTCPSSSQAQTTSSRRIRFPHFLVSPYYWSIREWQGDLCSIERDLNRLRKLLLRLLSRSFVICVQSLATMIQF